MKQLKKKKIHINQFNIALFLSASHLLFFIFFNILITTSFYFFKIRIVWITPIISLFLSTVICFIVLYSWGKNSFMNYFISIILPIMIIVVSIIISGKVIDYTYDGNSYQKATIGLLAIGWNPVYETIEEFEDKIEKEGGQSIHIKDESPLYMNHYAKGVNIYGANIYQLTRNIECGKSINFICIVMLFLYTISFLLHKRKGIFFSILFAICVATYPIVSSQLYTNYIDIITYVFLYLTIFLFFIFEEKNDEISYHMKLFIFSIILIISINIKFSLFAYVGIYCLGYYIWYIYRALKHQIDKKFLKQFTITVILSLIVGILVVGFSVYPKNFVYYGNPFYPLMGEGKVDIMTVNQPNNFKQKSALEKFIISTFSKVDNIIESSHEKPILKIPFSIYQSEFLHLSAADTRISGNGIWFSGIFLISLSIIIISWKTVMNYNKKLFILSFIPILITLLMVIMFDETWYARYFPQLYFIPLYAVISLELLKNKKWIRIMEYMFILLILVNNAITMIQVTKYAYQKNVQYQEELEIFDTKGYPSGSIIEIYTNDFNGAKFNILDRYQNKYKIVFKSITEDSQTIENVFWGGKIKWKYQR